MIPKTELRIKAINLRRQGLSYSEILKETAVAKSTLSLWLRSVGLSKQQKQRLTEKKLLAIKKGAQAKHLQRIERSELIRKMAKEEVSGLINDPYWLTGTILYWGEGTKQKEWSASQRVAFTNMNANSLKIFLSWAKRYLSLDESRFRFDIFIHEKSDAEKAVRFWADEFNIPEESFAIYLKRHNLNPGRKNIYAEYNGVCKISVSRSTDLNRRIAGWIEGVIKYLG